VVLHACFDSPQKNWLGILRSPATRALARRNSELLFPANVAIRSVWQIEPACGIAKNQLYEKDLKVRELTLSGTAKCQIQA